jgi:dTDP-glucose 4,6-dehydratase
VCVDNLLTSSRSGIKDLERLRAFTFIEADIADAGALQRSELVPIDAIIHLASPASPVDYERFPMQTMAANSMGTWSLVNLARETNASLVYVSTSEVYGDPLVHPQPETYWGNVDPTGPRSCYDEAKRFGEALVVSARRVHGIRANIIRPFNTYGPGMRHDDGRAIPAMIDALGDDRPLMVYGDGLQTRSFCFVSDLVDGLKHALLDPELDGEILNLGNPAEVTIRELAETIIRLVGRPVGIRYVDGRPGDPRRRRPVIERMTKRYGWTPRVTLEDGLRQTLAHAGIELRLDRSPGHREFLPSHAWVKQ